LIKSWSIELSCTCEGLLIQLKIYEIGVTFPNLKTLSI